MPKIVFVYEPKLGNNHEDITPQGRGAWGVMRRDEKKFTGQAGIEAYEQINGMTSVDFLDGYYVNIPCVTNNQLVKLFWDFVNLSSMKWIKQAYGPNVNPNFNRIHQTYGIKLIEHHQRKKVN